MEEIEGTNREAVANCHRVLNLLSKPQQEDHVGHNKNLVSETREAVFRFKRVASLLDSSSVGHARFRRAKKLQTHLPQSIVLDPCHKRSEPASSLKPRSGFLELSLRPSNPLPLGTKPFNLESNPKAPLLQLNQKAMPSLNLNSNAKAPLLQLNQKAMPSLSLDSNAKVPLLQVKQQPMPSFNYRNLFQEHLHKQQLQQQQQRQQQFHERLHAHHLHHKLLQQKHQAEIMRRKCNGGISLSFDNSCVTRTMSSTRSFVSSLSVDGSLANMEAKNSFRLLGVTDPSSNRKCPLKGTEHGSSSRCHGSKKRKPRVRRSIRVPAISNKVADIPPDEYSWRKYGQKPIKGSPYPRFTLLDHSVDSCMYSW